MGQVPTAFSQNFSYLLIGNGRVALHFARYFELESLPFQTWKRQDGETALRVKAENSTHVLLLISDGAIDAFARQYEFLSAKTCVHFSGSLFLEKIPGAHPLMTFATSPLYDLATYRRIPFVIEKGRGEPASLLPGLQNPIHFIEPKNKALYHALCVLGGNFSTLLWEKVFADFETKLGLPKSAVLPYMDQINKNLAETLAGTSVLTGPLVRSDHSTIERHLNELKNDPFEKVYRAFVEAYSAIRKEVSP